jgi:protoporphyrin/coproporphyrin ferrochelatase
LFTFIMKRAILLMNLGSPDSFEVNDVKRYLDEFLMDEKVIDKPWLLRAALVKGIIIPARAKRSADAYKSVWTDRGSALVVITEDLRDALQKKVSEPVVIAMRYGNPSPAKAFDQLHKDHPDLKEVIAVPMYPHYAMSSYETAVDYAKKIHRKGKYPFGLRFIRHFYNNDAYLNALSNHIGTYLQKDYDHILFSYHGIPERHITKRDITGCHCLKSEDCCSTPSPAHEFCYRHQCFDTTREVVARLQIPAGKWSNSFQSRLGRDPWLRPYTDHKLEEFPSKGIKKLLIVCPAFVSDCLETLEEIAEEGKETFLHAGGESYEMIPCLNTEPVWVDVLAGWVKEISSGNEDMILSTTFLSSRT